MSNNAMDLVWPAAEYLSAYAYALQQGWSPDNLRPQTALDHLAQIAEDPNRFLSEQVDREAKGLPIALPDGSMVPRLPGYSRWMWDGEFCGAIGFRWQPGTNELPSYCLGHVGYSVVPWKRRRGYATRALRLLLPQAKEEALSYIELTTDADNVASRRVIEANERHVNRTVLQTGGIWWRGESPFPYSPCTALTVSDERRGHIGVIRLIAAWSVGLI